MSITRTVPSPQPTIARAGSPPRHLRSLTYPWDISADGLAAFLVDEGIDSMSLNPDTVLKTTATILEKGKSLAPATEV